MATQTLTNTAQPTTATAPVVAGERIKVIDVLRGFATAPFLSAVYATTIMLLYRSANWRRRLAPLAAVGHLSLSNYLLQSLVAALVFTGYGLRLYGQVGAAWGLALSIAIFALQTPLIAWWLGRFQFGPTEWLLRSFTYGKLQPLRCTAQAKA